MRRYLVFTLCLILFACTSNKQQVDLKDYEKQTRYSSYLEIFEGKDTLIHIKNPETLNPDKKILISSIKGNQRDGYVTINPVQVKFLAMSSPQIGMLEEINALNSVKSVGNINYIYNPLLKSRYESKELVDQFDITDLNVEKVIASGANTILHEGWKVVLENEDKLIKVGLNPIPILDWKEQAALGRAEWLLLFGYLTGKADESKEKFNQICANYETLKKLAAMSELKPRVLAGHNFNGIWNAPAGESFLARILKDANVQYIYADRKGVGSVELNPEQVLIDSKNCQYWIDPGSPAKKEILRLDPKASNLIPFKNGDIFCYSHSTNFYWEKSAVSPDKLLADFVRIFHESDFPTDSLYFYRKILD